MMFSPALDIQSMRSACSPGGTVERPVGLSSMKGVRVGRLGVQDAFLLDEISPLETVSLPGDGLDMAERKAESSASGLKYETSRTHSFCF